MSDQQYVQNEDVQKLNDLQDISTEPLLKIRTVFPFRLFPCVITVDREKITISDQFFFLSKRVDNLLTKDIVSITSTENGFFSNITIVSGMRMNKEFSISHLKKDEAKKLRRIVEGILIASQEEIDLNNIPYRQLAHKLEEIGASRI